MTREYGLSTMVNNLFNKVEQFRSSESEHERVYIKEKICRFLAVYTNRIKRKKVSDEDDQDPKIDVLTELRDGLKELSIGKELQDKFFICLMGGDESHRYFDES